MEIILVKHVVFILIGNRSALYLRSVLQLIVVFRCSISSTEFPPPPPIGRQPPRKNDSGAACSPEYDGLGVRHAAKTRALAEAARQEAATGHTVWALLGSENSAELKLLVVLLLSQTNRAPKGYPQNSKGHTHTPHDFVAGLPARPCVIL